VRADFDSETKINSIHGWCIPAQGKDYEIKDKDAIETALFGVQDGELMSDLKTKLLTIPAADLGNIVGYEIDQEVRPYVSAGCLGISGSKRAGPRSALYAAVASRLGIQSGVAESRSGDADLRRS